jgi:hypothetical protein
MTTRPVSLVAAVALAASIAGAEIVHVEWTVGNAVLTPEHPTTLVTMTATWSPKYFFVATEFDIVGTNAQGGAISGIGCDVSEGLYEFGEITPDNSVLDFVIWTWPPMFHGHGRKPLHVWFEYTATDFTPRQIEYTSAEMIFALMTYEEWDYIEGEVEVSPVSFDVVPAPASVLALGVPVFMRRRRAGRAPPPRHS